MYAMMIWLSVGIVDLRLDGVVIDRETLLSSEGLFLVDDHSQKRFFEMVIINLCLSLCYWIVRILTFVS